MVKPMFLAAALAVTGAAHAGGLEINLSGQSGEFSYLHSTTSLVQGGLDLGVGFFYNQRGDTMVTGRVMSLGQQASYGQPIQLGVGAKAYVVNLDSGESLGGIGLGGRIGYVVPSSISPVAWIAEGYFAPTVTSFGKADRLLELLTRVEIEITPTALGYIGYRLTSVRVAGENSDVELDDNMHIGVRFVFLDPASR